MVAESAKGAAVVFGGKPEVRKYYDRDEGQLVGILDCRDRPNPGFVTYSTLGVHCAPNKIDDQDIRVEAGPAEWVDVARPNRKVNV